MTKFAESYLMNHIDHHFEICTLNAGNFFNNYIENKCSIQKSRYLLFYNCVVCAYFNDLAGHICTLKSHNLLRALHISSQLHFDVKQLNIDL